MKIALGNDHAGFELKNYIMEMLKKEGHEVEDFGSLENKSDYPDYAKKVATDVLSGSKGILVCGTGIGMSIAANKIKGIRAARCMNENDAELSRNHNDSNVLCLGGRVLEKTQAWDIVKKWLESDFEGGRHQERIDKIE
tara:strand:+ start:252 stop:668 length:417 start_codon:yes stop_codon:yes gene_type:complete